MKPRKLNLTALLVLSVLATSNTMAAWQTPSPAPTQVIKFEIKAPNIALADVESTVSIRALNKDGLQVKTFADTVNIDGILLEDDYRQSRTKNSFVFSAGAVTIPNVVFTKTGSATISLNHNGIMAKTDIRVIPGILSLLPPLFAITLAFAARQVLISLFSGIWLGALFIYDYNPILGFIRTVDTYVIGALADTDNASVLIFSLTLGGMVGIMSKAGGTQGIVEKLATFANHRRGGQIATWAMGLLIFFDDYANTLIVGNTMRSMTDRLKISREKLSYIVDSTAAPVASVALISTWIGFQVGLIDQSFKSVNANMNAYNAFLQSIPYSTYSILAILFVFFLAVTLRDFGPMLTAEKRAVDEGKVLRDGAHPIADSASIDMLADKDTPLRWQTAMVPIAVVIGVTLIGLYINGKSALGGAAASATLGQIFGEANSFAVLTWASFAGLLSAALMAIGQRILSIEQTMEATVNGYKSMLMAAMILVQAWAIGNICKDLHTADYVIELTRGILSPHFVPVVTFLIAAFISFSTGASWATMAILTPIMVPIAYKLPIEAGLSMELSQHLLIATIGAILSGSVLGDHCSPISDTTILSSMASAADHVDHVRTQLPYALVVGSVACLTGYLPTGWGLNSYVSLMMGSVILVGIVLLVGRSDAVKNE